MNFPDFFEQAPVVHTYDPFAAMLGAAREGKMTYRYVDAVRLAGHSCPTVAGAFLMGRAALTALYPEGPAERGNIAVHMPAPQEDGVTGVMAQVLTLLTGAAAENGFQGMRGRYRRKGLLSFSERREGEAIVFTRLDNQTRVAVTLDLSWIPADPAQGERLVAILNDSADASQQIAFAEAWQERVRRLLLEFAEDSRVINVTALN